MKIIKDKKALFLRVLVPVLIAIALTVIWIVKTHPTLSH
jgi:hypothetical protein